MDDKAELNVDSKLDNEINNNIILNELKKKEESEIEYEFEDYITKLNKNNPIYNKPSMLNPNLPLRIFLLIITYI